MTVSSTKIAKALLESLQDGTSPSDLAKKLEVYLADNHITGLVPKILSALDREAQTISSQSAAHISVSHDVSSATRTLIEKRIRKDERDKTVLSVVPDLIGGFRAVYRGKLFDGSLKNYVRELQAELSK